jgi:hypothetical protein
MDEASTARARRAINWFYDHYEVKTTNIDRAKDLLSIQIPWQDLVRMAEDLYDSYEEELLRAQHADLKSEYQRYQSLMYLIKSLTEHKETV